MAGTALFATISAVALLAYAAVFKTELLRSEKHVLMMTVSGIIGDSELDPAARERIGRAILDAVEPRLPRSAVLEPRTSGDSRKEG
jgi:hypothetical protein